MGLELVEVILRTEREFGIYIPDDTVEKLETVGDLYEYVVAFRAEAKGRPAEVSLAKIREVVSSTTSAELDSIHASTRLDSLLPCDIRRSVWKRLNQVVPAHIPSLRLKWCLGPIIALLLIPAGIYIGGKVAADTDIVVSALSIIASVALLWTCFFFASRPFATSFPRRVVTVGDLARAGWSREARQAAARPWSDEEIRQRIQEIVCDVCSAKPEDVTPTTHFIKDLDAG